VKDALRQPVREPSLGWDKVDTRCEPLRRMPCGPKGLHSETPTSEISKLMLSQYFWR